MAPFRIAILWRGDRESTIPIVFVAVGEAETIRMPIYTIDQMEGSVAEFAGKPNGAIIVLPTFSLEFIAIQSSEPWPPTDCRRCTIWGFGPGKAA